MYHIILFLKSSWRISRLTRYLLGIHLGVQLARIHNSLWSSRIILVLHPILIFFLLIGKRLGSLLLNLLLLMRFLSH